MPSIYYQPDKIAEWITRGEHRKIIGNLWEELGTLQLDFLRKNGLTPQSSLLDVGCGSLRLGVRAVDYLEPGNYWGTDISDSLIQAGYDNEIVPAGLQSKLPRQNLVADAAFTFAGITHDVDFIIAQSVFTHLPMNHLRLCLANLAEHVNTPCRFYLTVFIAPEKEWPRPVVQLEGPVTHPHRDPYHYRLSDIYHLSGGLPWHIQYIGDWGHPRNQKMVLFSRA
jgi:cyclopropane fatty-acyl-phospholipid synthase-like methyltransferase